MDGVPHDHAHHHHGHGHHGHQGHEHHAHAPADGASAERRLLWALVLTGGFTAVELAGGLIAGSLALVADGAHMLADAAGLALAFVSVRLARRPPDLARSYGYHRLEVLAAFVNGLVLLAIVAWIVDRGGAPVVHAYRGDERRHARDCGHRPAHQPGERRDPVERRPRQPQSAGRAAPRDQRRAGLGRRDRPPRW